MRNWRLLVTMFLGLILGADLFAQVEGSVPNSYSQTSSTYQVRPLDMVQVRLFVADELQFEMQLKVGQDGQINLPYIGSVEVLGKSSQQIREHIFVPYNRDYYVNPQIDLSVLAFNDRTFTISGKVNRQGTYALPSERSLFLMEAITMAGGWSNDRLANVRDVLIRRSLPNGQTQEFEVNTEEVGSREIEIKEGDQIVVPERRI